MINLTKKYKKNIKYEYNWTTQKQTNKKGFNGFSNCIRALYVSLYDEYGTLQTVIKFEHSFNSGSIETVVNYSNEGELSLTGSVELDIKETWVANPSDSTEPWCFLLTKQWGIPSYQPLLGKSRFWVGRHCNANLQ